MPSESSSGDRGEHLRGKIEDLAVKVRGPIDEEEDIIEFSELRDVILDVREGDDRELAGFLERMVTEEVVPRQIEGASLSDYIELTREVEGSLNTENMVASYVCASDDEEVMEEFIQGALNDDGGVDEDLRWALLVVCYSVDPKELADHIDVLLNCDDQELHETVREIAVNHPTRMRHAANDLFERFEEGECRVLFPNFLSELCRTQPKRSEEWVEGTLREVTDDDLGKGEEIEDMRSVQDCVETLSKRFPFIATEVARSETELPEDSDRLVTARIIRKEARSWKSDRESTGRRALWT